MKKAFVFPGQGAQFVGMGKDLYENSPEAKELFEKANEILGDSVVTTGSVSSSIVPPREIFICALEKKAVHIVMVHNHPSGRAVPSGEDNTVTARIAEAGKLLGIALSDHIIIGDRTYFSYREAGYLT
ncbi:MAG: acyltransferase domain-containing protein [Roseburia inulinivorans]|nr:acyltransferase domain-containing protein [Roseburia inulinivorans]